MTRDDGRRLRPPPPILWEELLRRALREDLGRGGDVTTDAVVDAGLRAEARILARRPGRVAGGSMAARVFTLLDGRVDAEILVADGDDVDAGEAVARLWGPARALLTGERVALNFLGHLCGIATVTAEMVEAVAETGCRIVDTRKTTPGLRTLEKYAVRCGGGANHRMGLDDAVLIKDNHVALAGSVTAAIDRARDAAGHTLRIEVEVDTLEQLREALAVGVDAVLLDNMEPARLAEAVRIVEGRAVTEASGGIGPTGVEAVAAAGVDLISVGRLTHSAPSLDVAMEVIPLSERRPEC